MPVYIIMLNLFGFLTLTLPLHALTPEVRRVRELEKAILRKE